MRHVFLLALLTAPLLAQTPRVDWVDALEASAVEVGVGVVFMQAQYEELLGRPQSLSVLVVEAGVRIDVADADQRELTSTLAARGGALAAVNGGFFEPDGAPVGYLKDEGIVVGSPKPDGQAGLAIDKGGDVFLGAMPRSDTSRWFEALGAGPMLLRHGAVIDHGEKQRRTRHPRTGVGERKDGTLVFLVADGRNERAGGVSFEEYAALFKALGCTDAVNLDGGGSSTMWIRGHGATGVVNHPSDNQVFDHAGERAVSNAVLIHAPRIITIDNNTHEGTSSPGANQRTDGERMFGPDFAWYPDGAGVTTTWSIDLSAGKWRVEMRWPRVESVANAACAWHGDRTVTLVRQVPRHAGAWRLLGTIDYAPPPQPAEATAEKSETAPGAEDEEEPAPTGYQFRVTGRPGQPFALDALRFVQVRAR